MAVIKITRHLLLQILQEKLVLPNKITEFKYIETEGGRAEIVTEIDSFADREPAMPVYSRDVRGSVKLMGADRVK